MAKQTVAKFIETQSNAVGRLGRQIQSQVPVSLHQDAAGVSISGGRLDPFRTRFPVSRPWRLYLSKKVKMGYPQEVPGRGTLSRTNMVRCSWCEPAQRNTVVVEA